MMPLGIYKAADKQEKFSQKTTDKTNTDIKQHGSKSYSHGDQQTVLELRIPYDTHIRFCYCLPPKKIIAANIFDDETTIDGVCVLGNP